MPHAKFDSDGRANDNTQAYILQGRTKIINCMYIYIYIVVGGRAIYLFILLSLFSNISLCFYITV